MTWKRASKCDNSSGNCVEVNLGLPGAVAVRDTKDGDGAALAFTTAEWATFIEGVKAGEFDV